MTPLCLLISREVTSHYCSYTQTVSVAPIVTFWVSVILEKSREMEGALGQMSVQDKWVELADKEKVCCFSGVHSMLLVKGRGIEYSSGSLMVIMLRL